MGITTTPKLHTLSIGLPRTLQTVDGKEFISAICKESSTEAYLSIDGFRGDGIADTKHHGGPDRGVCIYPAEHYPYLENEFSCTLPSSTFGENLTVSGMIEDDVCIGDIFHVGEAVIQVTQGRIPCSKINKRTGLPDLMKKIVETGFTGYLCRVLEEGIVRDDSRITLMKRDPHGVSILFANEVYFHRSRDLEGLKRIAAVDALATDWQEKIAKRIMKLQSS
ncbi:MOSC domain-containing protein [Sporosarcina obsidiansis]|uniref:MOSC domain-containing protein n=1 Tax=Sporosarcina obsidiansis TaxID=2660748 RepID=UPI001E5D0438|nr:MOSC domain-containing protein [Sporosarcina obsidiansis]